MCDCLSFVLENPALQKKWAEWFHFRSLLARSWQSLPTAEAALDVAVNEGEADASLHELSDKRVAAAREEGCVDGLLEKCGIYVIRRRRALARGHASMAEGQPAVCANTGDLEGIPDKHSEEKQERVLPDHHAAGMLDSDYRNQALNKRPSQVIEIPQRKDGQSSTVAFSQERLPRKLPRTILTNGGDDTFSLFMQQGLKGMNQDSMAVCENFLPLENVTFCGVFDGHGAHGHHISNNVRDKLPAKMASCWQALQASSLLAQRSVSPEKSTLTSRGNLDPDSISIWEEAFHCAFSLMDRDILLDEDVDCIYSGSTALTLVKQGNDIILANVGDSRAVMGVKFQDSLVALQLTADLTPNLPREEERIRRSKGRVLALRKDPFIKRVWLPHKNSPGLAMSRAFGDYILKNFGVISVPEVTHRRISKNDKFVVLATDGVWDVLSNEQVVRIVDAAPVRSTAAQAVVDTAVHAWKVKYPETNADDCAVVCMFLNSAQTDACQARNSTW